MKRNRLFVIICICISCQNLFAQNSDTIAADLTKLFKKLPEYDFYNPQHDLVDTVDSLIDSKISFYIKTAPVALAKAFPKLGAASSPDSVINIFSWDNQSGGTQHSFTNLFLYKSKGRLNYINFDTLAQDDEYPRYYDRIYNLAVGDKTYYLITYKGILDLNERMEGIQIFSVADGKLNNKVKLIKTHRGFTHKLRYEYYFNMDDQGGMQYNPKLKEITFPVVNKNKHITGDSIIYKFTGRYFEKVKN
jgi:hypothetical protein